MVAMMGIARQLVADRRGSIAVMSAGALLAIVGFTAISIDLATMSIDRRRAQSVADLAAMAAASDLPRADRAANATVERNGLALEGALVVQTGRYVGDPSRPVENRFEANAPGSPNAARVTLTTRSDLFFGKVFGHRHTMIRTQSTAATSALASIAIGSRLLSLDRGLLNAVLGGLLGTRISLSVMDYEALANVKIDLFKFLPHLGARLRLEAVTYDKLLSSNVKLVDVVGAIASAAVGPNGVPTVASKALDLVAVALSGGGPTIPLERLVDLGPYKGMSVGEKPVTSIFVSALDLLNATAQIGNGSRQVAVGLDANLPGIASVTLKLAIGERPVGTSWMAVGQAGISVHTAQTRILLLVDVIGREGILDIRLPLYLELAPATARLDNVNCAFPDGSRSTLSVSATPGVADIWVADVSAAEFNNYSVQPRPGPVKIVDTAVLDVTARAHVGIANMSPRRLDFTMADIEQLRKKTVGTTDITRSLLVNLIQDLDLKIQLLGLGITVPGGVKSLLLSILNAVTPSLDKLLVSLLNLLGIGLGQVDVWATGLRCDGAVLVN